MAKRLLTQEDIDNNPSLLDQGLKVGDEIDIPNETNSENFSDDDTGGTAPPPNKERTS